MTPTQLAYLGILAVCTVASGFVSGSETALIGIPQERVHRLAERSRRGRAVRILRAEPDRMLSTLLVANNLVNVLAAAVATTLFIELVGEDWGPWVATGVVTAILLVFGEITPKTLAARYPEQYALVVAPTILRLSRVLSPVARVFAGITRGLLGLVGVRGEEETNPVTEDDIRALAELGERGGEIEEVEREIIDALFSLADRPIREVMTPRVDIVALTRPVTMDAVRQAVAETGHSRYPVVDEDLDTLVGMLYVKDLLRLADEPTPAEIDRLLRRPIELPESTTILSALQDIRRRRSAIAIVLDEHGGVEGLITAKDLLAELVGELQDEYDPGAPAIVPVDADAWVADGRLPVEELARVTATSIPDGPYATVAGLFMALAGRVPDPGDEVVVDRLRLVVLDMDRNRINRLRVERRRRGGTIGARPGRGAVW
ncbi:MAG TPA: HlyC/CorC family transporter [Actinobacteria bacterium]|nr:HlyC/CorC family transporter [Actinomycetota bacterium]